MELNVWDKNVPVEKSPYLQSDEVSFFNLDNFKPPNDVSTKYMIDLFCGAGGFSAGCSMAGFTPIFGIDHFKPAIQTWTTNHPNTIGCLGDIRNVPPENIKRILNDKGINHIHLLTGGVPCQGFTIANRKHNDNDERNFLYLEYMKYVSLFHPDIIVLENVSGMRSTAGGKFEKSIKKNMEDLGYITSVKMINAADYGVPQQRQRLLFVGISKSLNIDSEFVFPQGKFSPENYRTVDDAFSDLPSIKAGEKSDTYKSPPQNDYQKMLRGLGDYPVEQPAQLYNHVSPNHPQSTVDMIGNTPQGAPLYPTFKQRIRLSLNYPSPTQLAGGIRPSFQFGHPTDARGLTTRERARIQSFPDSYIFKGGIVQERVQTGNAVPPLMIFNIAKELIKYFK